MVFRKLEIELARKLAVNGYEMDVDLSSNHEELFNQYRSSSYLGIAVASALTWTGHAIHEKEYYDYAIEYLSSGKDTSLREAVGHYGRFGLEKLSEALKSWRILATSMITEDLQTCDASRLWRIQEYGLSVAQNLRKADKISGIGPWLYCAPFKIIAIHRRDLWDIQSLDNLMMPIGLEVNRGVKKLIRNEYGFTEGITEEMLSEVEGDLIEGSGTIILVQSMSKKLAEAAGSRVLHINSGLYLYGGDRN